MAIFGFGGKPAPPQAPPMAPSSPPTDKVLAMRQQGLSNNQIIQNLQNAGYDPNLIFDALNQADLKGGVDNLPLKQDEFGLDQMQNPMQLDQFDAPRLAQSASPAGPPPMDMPGADSASLERIEEIAEAIIDEKWNEIVKSVNKIIDWKDRTEAQIMKIEQQVSDLRSDFDNLTKGVLGKIGEYDQNITNIGSEIKAMENVFQKVLPNLTESVHTLDRLTKDIKGRKKA
jgi:hypothetical protein